MKQNLLALGLVATLGMTLTACSTASTGRTITIEMTDFKLTPAQVEVKAGEQITWDLQNKSGNDHEFESDAGKLEEVLVPSGKSKQVNWTAPNKPG
ncbi:MAG TPA: cupredoxin domain-containing protein, partial [Symbiobacteriaceae bacterium]|nr:cupredoxin domain-containing protein [Symbiobacteriaceae bacterium]